MQHTQTANAKKEVIEVFFWLGSGTIISEVHKVYDAYRFSMMKRNEWDGEEVNHYNHIINSVTLFTSCLTQLYIESSTEVVSSPAEIEAFGKKSGAAPNSIETDKFLTIGEKLFSKFSCREITDTLWECYFETMCIKGADKLKRSEISSIGFTLKMITQIIAEMDFLINRVEKETAVLN